MSRTKPIDPAGLGSSDRSRVQVRLHNAKDKLSYNWLQYNAPDLNKAFLLEAERMLLPKLDEYLARAGYNGGAATTGERLF